MDGVNEAFAAARLSRRLRSVLFDEDFAAPPPPPEPEVIAPGPADAALTAARAEAWADGYAAGRTEAEAAGARALRDAGAALAAALEGARAELREQAEANAEALARLLLETIATLFPELCRRHGNAEVLALVRTLLPGLAQEPTVRIALAPALAGSVEEELDRALDPERRERVRVNGDPRMAAGDVRVSWSAGIAQRDGAAVWREVASVLGAAGLAATAPVRVVEDVG